MGKTRFDGGAYVQATSSIADSPLRLFYYGASEGEVADGRCCAQRSLYADDPTTTKLCRCMALLRRVSHCQSCCYCSVEQECEWYMANSLFSRRCRPGRDC